MADKHWTIPAYRNHFRHLKQRPPLSSLPPDAEVPPLGMIPDEDFCETGRAERQVVSPPRVCNCGEYDLEWEQ